MDFRYSKKQLIPTEKKLATVLNIDGKMSWIAKDVAQRIPYL